MGLLSTGDVDYDDPDEFVPDHLPDARGFLADHDVLCGDDHVAVHRTARDLFERRGVYDMTFGYNLATLNRDPRHPEAGYRYAVERDADAEDVTTDDGPVLRAAFTPTTPFCPQSETLVKGSFRAWNGLAEEHEYELVRIRVAPMHHRSETINAELEAMERELVATGSLPEPDADPAGTGGAGGAGDRAENDGVESPF